MDYAHLPAESEEQFVQGAAVYLKSLISASLEHKDSCLLGLSGGSTPGPIYTALGQMEDVDWSKVWVCLVDERYTGADDAKSNAKLIKDTLLAHADIPATQWLFPDTSLPLGKCVTAYHEAFKSIHPDIVTLGMGPDGHIASVFPPVADDAFDIEGAMHTQTDQFDVKDRITLTLPTIAAAHSKVFLLKGESKKVVWEAMNNSDEGPERWPAKIVIRSGGASAVTFW